jgi:hypothetical protein
MKIEDIRIGQSVWFLENNRHWQHCKVFSLSLIKLKDKPCAHLRSVSGADFSVSIDRIYSEEESKIPRSKTLQDEINNIDAEIAEKYAQIKQIEDEVI